MNERRSAPPMTDMFSIYDQERMPKRVYDEHKQYTFTSPQWRCEVHGDTNVVVTIFGMGTPSASYCVACILSAMDKLGVRALPRVD